VSSQLLTGLLIALAHCTEPSELIVSNLTSRPYIDMTIAILQDFGIQVENRDYHSFYIAGGAQSNLSNYYVEGDWSGAAFLIVAAALAGTAEIKNLSSSSSQGDMAIIDIVRSCGVDIKQHDNSVTIDHSILKPFTCDATECPDLFPPLVALASACPGESRISGVHRLAYKESNRGDVLVEEFVKIGVPVRKEGNDLVITGGKVRGGVAHSCNDHRIAMALAVAGLVSEIGVTIEEAQVVDKSYPGFFEDLHNLGVEVQ
jgi:3-phosphoshikimate 1-carboxyvinyltransferase